MKKNLRRVGTLMVILLFAFSVAIGVSASSGPPTDTSSADFDWDGTNWTFQATSDTFCDGAPSSGPCEKVCLEIALDDGSGGQSNFTRFDHTTTEDPDENSAQTLFAFVVTPPNWAKDVQSPASVVYQYYLVNQSASNCEDSNKYNFTGWQPGFTTGPNVVALNGFFGSSPLLLTLVAAGVVMSFFVIRRKRR